MTTIYPRSLIGVPEPPSTREVLRPSGVLMVHWSGVGDRADLSDLEQATRAARYGAAIGNRWEYNYMVGRNGAIFEQAGRYRAGHCLNFNSETIGVLCLVGVGYPSPGDPGALCDLLGNGVRALRAELELTGQLLPNNTVEPHYGFRNTACPGALADPPGAKWPPGEREGRSGAVKWPLQVRD